MKRTMKVCAYLLFASFLAPSFLFAAPSTPQFRFKRSLIDILLPKKPVDTTTLGINAFVNDSRFGTIKNQFLEVKNTLGIKYVRILMNWDNNVQPTKGATPNFAFYDSMISNLPANMEAFAVITALPSWMKNSSNWIDGDPRKTFVELWVKKVAERYKSNPKFKGIQVWNEQNMLSNPDNTTLDLAGKPENYVSLMAMAYPAIKEIAPNMLVISSATTSIIQGYPNSLQYNRNMKTAGLERYIDVWSVHYYGKSIENIIRPGGVKSFLSKVTKPLWVTESGAQGTTKQREYVERYWTFLRSEIRNIKRMYFYQFTESSPANTTYGLRNLTPGKLISDFYIYLRERKKQLNSTTPQNLQRNLQHL